MALDSEAVRVAVSGAVYVGPIDTAAPTDTSTELDAAFLDLGYVSESGISESITRDTTQIRGWQNGALLREVTSSGSYAITLTFLETNLNVLELYYGSTITSGALDGDPASTGGKQSFVIDVIDGSDIERIYIHLGEVTSIGERTLASGEAIGYEVTITALADENNVTFKKWFSSLEV